MRSLTLMLTLLLTCAIQPSIHAQEKSQPGKTGIQTRIPWTSSRIIGTPDPPLPYTTVPAYPRLKFVEPLAADQVPETNRLVIAERPGKIYTFEDRPGVDKKKLLLDASSPVYSVAMHPSFAKNGLFFLTRIKAGKESHPGYVEVVRYQVKNPATLSADPKSGKTRHSMGSRRSLRRLSPIWTGWLAVYRGR